MITPSNKKGIEAMEKEIGLYGAICKGEAAQPAGQSFLGYVSDQQVKAADKAEMYRLYQEALIAGEIFKLRVTVVPHRNGLENANFWRMKVGAYKSVAKSFAGMPFQRDHSLRLENRGGTILSSKAAGSGDDAYMIQELEIVEPWAIEGFLRGTIDRFSIHINNHDIKAFCSICGLSAFDRNCPHWPGQTYEIDKGEVVCWYIVHEATGKETSAVVDPAVANTGIEQIMQLAASKRGLPLPSPEEEEDMEKIEELKARVASLEEELVVKDEAIAAKDEELEALKVTTVLATETIDDQTARLKSATGVREQAEQAMVVAQAAMAETQAAMAVVQERICADLVSRIQEVFAASKPLDSLEVPTAQSEEDLRRILCAAQIIIEKHERGKCFEDLQAEQESLSKKSPEVLAEILSELRTMPLPQETPPMGRGSHLSPQKDLPQDTDPKADKDEETDAVDDTSAADAAGIFSQRPY